MNAIRRFHGFALAALMVAPGSGLFAQCTNAILFPSLSITPDNLGALTTISTCSFQQEYSNITGVIAGATYQFTCTNNTYITVHQDTPGGAVLGQGFSPLTITAVTAGNLYPHWNVDAACGLASGVCQITTVQLFLNCTPPSATIQSIDDCVNNAFSVQVNVSSLGDGAWVNILYDVNGVPTGNMPTLGIGSYMLGPFTVGQIIDITVAHDSDATCNLHFNGVQSQNTCPTIITCGGANAYGIYCYVNNDNQHWLYQSSGTQEIALQFTQGTIENAVFDHLRIYNGIDNSTTPIYDHVGVMEDLTGLTVVSNGGPHALYMEMTSDGSVSCSTMSETEWHWTIGCLDCTPAAATYSVVLNCANNTFNINTHLTTLGSDSTLDITNTGGAPMVTATDTGNYSVGPFAFGSLVRIDLVNSINTLCSVHSTYLTNAPCPLVSCGPNHYTYCYHNNLDSSMVYQSANTFPIAMIFNSGDIATYGDSIYIWDGPDYQSNLIFSGYNTTGNLSQLLFTSTNPQNALTMKFRSNFFTSCTDGGTTTPWDWNVSCLDCTNPQATFQMVPDCPHHGFNIAVNIASTGTAPTVRLVNSLTGDTLNNVGVGTTLVGPIPVDSSAHITVLNSQNPLCRVLSPTFTFPSDSCITTACAATQVTYCYMNADTAWFVYQSGNSNPISIHFIAGPLLVNDYIQVFNGLDNLAQLVYMGNQGGQLAGLNVGSNNANNALCLRVISNAAGSCFSGETSDIWWAVSCGLVGVGELTDGDFSIYPNPTDGTLYLRLPANTSGTMRMEVFDVTGRVVLREQFTAVGNSVTTFDLHELQSGNYTVVLVTNDWVKAQQLQVTH